MTSVGNILEIDLSSGAIHQTPFPENLIDTYMAGRGFNVGYLYEHLSFPIDPLSEENILLISRGLLTGGAAPTSSRIHINALSPLTGILGSSNIGGHVGAWLDTCNVQSIVIRGKAVSPVYLLITSEGITLRDARPLWRLDTIATQAQIEADFEGQDVKVLTIGPAGENGVPFACIVSGGDHAAGRTGMGAVMGSKNLKAVAVVKPPNQRRAPLSATAKSAIRDYIRLIKSSPEFSIFSRYGSAGYVKWADDMGFLSAHNFRQHHYQGAALLDGKHLERHRERSSGCARCPIHCKAQIRFKDGNYAGYQGARPEFEPTLNMGAKCGLKDLPTLVYLDNLCTKLGIDSLSTSGVIAFAMDLFERGILTRDDTAGLRLKWGDGAVMETLIRQICDHSGFGKVLAQGVRGAAESIGRGSNAYAPHVKGLELTAYHPNHLLGAALGYAVSSRGGDFNNTYSSFEHRWTAEQAAHELGVAEAVDPTTTAGKGQLIARSVLVNIVVDSLGLCKIPTLSLIGTFDLEAEAALAAAITGRPITAASLFMAGERIAALERLFNMRQGMTRQDDILPSMFLDDPSKRLNAGNVSQMVADFYQAMGWDDRGSPKASKLARLGIEGHNQT